MPAVPAGVPIQSVPLPGIALRVNGAIYDLAADTPEQIAELPNEATAGSAVLTSFGFVATTPTRPWSDLWLIPSDGSDPRLFAQNVAGFAIHGVGERMAWAEINGDCGDGTTAVWVEALLPSGEVIHRSEPFDGWDLINQEFGGTNGCSSVAAYVGDVVVVQTGDGAASASGTWVPATGAVRFIADYQKFGGGYSGGESILLGDWPLYAATMLSDGTVVVPEGAGREGAFEGGWASSFSSQGDRVLSIGEDFDKDPIENSVLVESYPSGEDLVRIPLTGNAMQIAWIDDATVAVLGVSDVDYVVFRCDLDTEDCVEAVRVRPEVEGFNVVGLVREYPGA